MQNKEISQKVLNPNAVEWITKLQTSRANYEQHILPRRFVKIRHAPSHSSYTQTITVACSNAQSKNTYAVASTTTY